MDIPVPKIGRQERELVLRIDAGAIPLENAVHDHRVTQVVDARTGLALQRFNPGTPQYIDEPIGDAVRSVACISLIVPEQAGILALRRLRRASRLQIFTQRRQPTVGHGQEPGFEETRLPDGDRAGLQIDVTEVQARKNTASTSSVMSW